MVAEVRLDDLTDLVIDEAKCGILELFDHSTPAKPAEVPTQCGGTRIVRVEACEFGEVFTGRDTFHDPLRFGARPGHCVIAGLRDNYDLAEREELRALFELAASFLKPLLQFVFRDLGRRRICDA